MDDAGRAFPRTGVLDEDGCFNEGHPGMSLLDWFAGQALGGFIACYAGHEGGLPDWEEAAESAYGYAAAMLAERAKRREGAG